MRPGVAPERGLGCANITVPVQMLPELRKRCLARANAALPAQKSLRTCETPLCTCKSHHACANVALPLQIPLCSCTSSPLHTPAASCICNTLPPRHEHPQSTPLHPSNHRPAFYLFTSIINKSPLLFFINRQTLERVKAVTRAAPDFRGGGGPCDTPTLLSALCTRTGIAGVAGIPNREPAPGTGASQKPGGTKLCLTGPGVLRGFWGFGGGGNDHFFLARDLA